MVGLLRFRQLIPDCLLPIPHHSFVLLNKAIREKQKFGHLIQFVARTLKLLLWKHNNRRATSLFEIDFQFLQCDGMQFLEEWFRSAHFRIPGKQWQIHCD